MRGKTAAIIGATGMIGKYLVDLLLKDPYFERVRLIVRRPIAKTHEKMEIKLVDFKDRESLHLALEETDALFCCIGTTQKKVKGDKKLYYNIDYDIPVLAAGLCNETGCEHFMIITCIGANSQSSNFYLKLKGEVEDELEKIGLRYTHIFQPSVLLGHRAEKRSGESILQGSMRFINPIVPKKYRGIEGKKLALAMINAAKQSNPGFFRYTYSQIIELAGKK